MVLIGYVGLFSTKIKCLECARFCGGLESVQKAYYCRDRRHTHPAGQQYAYSAYGRSHPHKCTT